MTLPVQPPPRSITAIVDTREQLPLNLEPLHTVTATLDTGDYSVAGLERVIRIERKSEGDLLSCIGTDRERFDREVQRLLAFPVRALVVESTWSRIEAGGWRSRVTSESAIGSLLGWTAMGLPIVMASDHDRAGKWVAKLLFITARRRWREARALVECVTSVPAESEASA